MLNLIEADWQHHEMEFLEDGDSGIGTSFQNNPAVNRGVIAQHRRSEAGFSVLTRDYMAEGEESLSPPIDRNALAFFGLREIEFERFKVQFGGCVETQRYRSTGSDREEEHHDEEEEGTDSGHENGKEDLNAIYRMSTGASAAAGSRADLGPRCIHPSSGRGMTGLRGAVERMLAVMAAASRRPAGRARQAGPARAHPESPM